MLFSPDHCIRFDVSDHRKHEKGFTIYKVNYMVYIKGSSEVVKNEVLWKRFSDFQKLHHDLEQKHRELCLSDKFPKFAKGTFFKRFEEDVIQERQYCAKNLLEFIGEHPALYLSGIFTKFLENGYIPRDCSTANVNPSLSMGSATTSTKQLCQIGIHEECQQFVSSLSVENELTVADVFAAICESIGMPMENVFEGDGRFWHLPISRPLSVTGTHCSLPYSSTSDGDYVIEADRHMEEAYKYESAGAYAAAMASLKLGLSCLLMGAYGEKDSAKRCAVKMKSCSYLQKAEKLHSNLLSRLHVPLISSACSLACPLSELRAYKVVGFVAKVMLVINVNNNNCYVMKVLQKSPCPVNSKGVPVLPLNVPYMVKVHFYFETDDNVFLVLQYASGGRLWDLIGSSQHSKPAAPVHWMMQENVYLGRKLIDLTQVPFASPEESSRNLALPNFDCKSNDADKTISKGSENKVSSHNSQTCPETSAPFISRKCFKEGGSTTLQLNDFTESCLSQSISNIQMSHGPLSTQSTDTADLMRNAQKLLESVSRTLEMSSCEDSEVEDEQLAVNMEEGVKVPASQQAPHFIPRKSLGSRPLECCSSNGELAKSCRSTSFRQLNVFSRYLPESQVRCWAEQLVLALITLHQSGLIFRDLQPENVLLASEERVLLSFICSWPSVDTLVRRDAVERLYAAPEVASIFEAMPAADWWSLGALLFELITGQPLYVSYPGGIHSHSILTFPDHVSPEARSLITELLRYHPHERLGAGSAGAEEVKSHPFFADTDWKAVQAAGLPT